MTKNILLLSLGLFIMGCTTTPEKTERAGVVDKTDSGIMTDDSAGEAETSSEVQTFGTDAEQTTILQQLEDPDSLLSLRIIYFDYDSSTVLSEFEAIIQAHASFLQANPDMVATLEGHADERGSREYNLALGEQRTLSVKQQLVVLGAASNQVRVVSYGEERPADPGHNEQAWSLNRRVEIVY